MQFLRTIFWWLLKLCLWGIITSGIWVLLLFAQQQNYKVPNQAYLMSTHLSYSVFFVFALLLPVFLYLIYINRKNPVKLKRRFYLFSIFYLITSPLLVFAFDNYVLVTQNGILYNTFISMDDEDQVESWSNIEKLSLDYGEDYKTDQSHKYRLKFILHFKDKPPVDLNNLNSPLYRKDQFLKIYNKIVDNGVPVETVRPLPEHYSDTNSLLWEMYSLSKQEGS